MDKNIKTIGLIVKNNEQAVIENFKRLHDYLQQNNYEILIDESAGKLLVQTLLNLITKDANSEDIGTQLIPPRLIVRESSG